MKNNAFTLIELLAVIVILAIIALIAVPIILNIIDDSKKSASMRGAELYLDTAEKSIVAYQLKNTDKKIEGKCDVRQDGNLQCGEILVEVEMNGTKPTSGTLTIQDGEIIKVESLIIGKDEFNTDSKGNLVMSEATQEPVEPTDAACFTYIDNYDYTINTDTCNAIYGSTFDGVLGDGAGALICSGNGKDEFGDFINLMNSYGLSKDQLVEQGVITLTNANPNGTVTITGYSCGLSQEETGGNNLEGKVLDVVIPEEISGKKVTSIGPLSFSTSSVSGTDITKKVLINSVVIPNTVTSIEFSAFTSNKLTNVTLGNSVKNIGTYAFSNNQLTNINLPNTLAYIGIESFSSNKLQNIVIPNSVTKLGMSSFSHNKLESLTLSNKLTSIEDGAFNDNLLTSIVIPDSVTGIYGEAFSDNQLTNVKFGNSVSTILVWAFKNNKLSNITLPNSIKKLEGNAFVENQLTSVIINAPKSQVTLDSDVFGWAEGYSDSNIQWASE